MGPWKDVPPIIIFTDGACEQEESLVFFGAVILDPLSGSQEVVGVEVPSQVVHAWRAGGKRQVIYSLRPSHHHRKENMEACHLWPTCLFLY